MMQTAYAKYRLYEDKAVNSSLKKIASEIEAKCNFLLIKEKKYCVISPDIDGLLSYLLYKKYINKDVEIVGTYNTEILFLSKNISFDEMFLLDGNISLMDSIDHHTLNYDLVNGKTIYLNPNLIFDNQNQVTKCPLNTELLLVRYSREFLEDIYEAIETHNNRFIALLLYGDNVLKNLQKYSANFYYWFERENLKELFFYVKDNFSALLEETKRIHDHLITLGYNKGIFRNQTFFFTQKRDDLYYNTEAINQFLEEFCKDFELNSVKCEPFKRYYKFETAFCEDRWLPSDKKNIVSHAVMNDGGKISVSYIKRNENCSSKVMS